jgi:diguanylate cyclase (GGDEF)-like protein
VTIDQGTIQHALLESARTLARGGDLDERLATLCAHARTLSGAERCVIALLDGSSGTLVPAAADGDGQDPPVEALERVARTRQGDGVGRDAGPGVVALALVTEDAQGSEQVEGVIGATFAGSAPDAERLAGLEAIAHLAASAIHTARLGRLLEERTDWYERVAHTDPLTGLANRRTFERMLELELARAIRQGSPISVAVFDVDGLGTLSDRHGADVGDDVLRRVASTLADSVRLVDTVARFGGDEFIVLAPGSAGRTVAERITAAVAALEPVGDAGSISVSGGVARYPDDGATTEALLEAAETALREAKGQGPGSVVASAGTAAADRASGGGAR